jgi:hypothetical protein
MLNVLVLAILVLAAVLLVLFLTLCAAIRQEDRSPRLDSRPPSACAAIARRIAGLSVHRPAGPDSKQADPGLALSGSPEDRKRR